MQSPLKRVHTVALKSSSQFYILYKAILHFYTLYRASWAQFTILNIMKSS